MPNGKMKAHSPIEFSSNVWMAKDWKEQKKKLKKLNKREQQHLLRLLEQPRGIFVWKWLKKQNKKWLNSFSFSFLFSFSNNKNCFLSHLTLFHLSGLNPTSPYIKKHVLFFYTFSFYSFIIVFLFFYTFNFCSVIIVFLFF